MKSTRSIALILCLIMLLGLMTACQKKMPQTAAGFTQIMENAGFEVYDESDNGEDSIATAAVYAVGENYQIEYYGYEDSDSARRVYDNNQNKLDEDHSAKRMTSQMETNRYNYYAFSTEDDFYVIARIENTVVFCAADSEYKQEILTHMEALGYK